MATLEDICRTQPARENYYSKSYHTRNLALKKKGQQNFSKQIVDLTKITIPFDDKDEFIVRTRYDIPKEKIEEFYTRFSVQLEKSLMTLANIHSLKNDTLSSHFRHPSFEINPAVVRKDEETGVLNIYVPEKPLIPLLKSRLLSNGIMSVQTLLEIGYMYARIVTDLDGTGLYLNGFSLEETFVDRSFNENKGSELNLRLGALYSLNVADGPRPLPTAPPFLDENVRKGIKAPSAGTDIKMICSCLWSALFGETSVCVPFETPIPEDAPENIKRLLIILKEVARSAETRPVESITDLSTALLEEIENIKAGSINNVITFFPEVDYEEKYSLYLYDQAKRRKQLEIEEVEVVTNDTVYDFEEVDFTTLKLDD